MIECGTLQDPCRHGKRACTLVYTRRAFARRVRTASLRLSVTTYKSYIVGGMGRDHLNKHVPVTMCGLALGGCACVVALGRLSRRAGAHGVWHTRAASWRALGAGAARRRIFQSAGATFHTGQLEEALESWLAAAAGGGEGLAHAV